MASKGSATWSVQVEGLARAKRAFRAFGDGDATYVREALDRSGEILANATAARAPGGIAKATRYIGVRGKGLALRAVVNVRHPGARSMEFGRIWYWASPGAGNNAIGFRRAKGSMKAGRKVRSSPGQAARPYVGIISGGAIAAVAPEVQQILQEAYEREFERIANGPDEGAGDA